MSQISSVKLLNAVIATGAGEAMRAWTHRRSFQAMGTTSAGAGAATIQIWVSDVDSPSGIASDVDWVLLGTITLTLGTTQTTDGFASEAAWRHVRAKVSAISGTDATVTCWMGS